MARSKADAPFIFEGSVKALANSNVEAVPADKKTAVVTVDHVRHSPRVLAAFAGKEITVRMAPDEKLKAGDRAVFYAESLVFGHNLAVQSLGHEPVISHASAIAEAVRPAVRQLRSRMDAAQAVVSGRVTEVRPPADVTVRTAVASMGRPRGRISEHEPFWKEAVIDVSTVHKGPQRKNVVVRFPASTDIQWYKSPKFSEGQTGTWLLHSDAPPHRAAALATSAPVSDTFTCLDPDDFHPAGGDSVVEAMLPIQPASARGVMRSARSSDTEKAVKEKQPLARRRAAKTVQAKS